MIAQHIFSMQMTYPDLFAEEKTTDSDHIAGVNCDNRRDWFLDAMYAYLAAGHTGTFAKYDDDDAQTVLANVKKAVSDGPGALEVMGKSSRYLEHMGMDIDEQD